jgi:hypothetical protein
LKVIRQRARARVTKGRNYAVVRGTSIKSQPEDSEFIKPIKGVGHFEILERG